MLATTRTVACALVAALLLAGCNKQPASEASTNATPNATSAQVALPGNLKITSWGPDNTNAGAVFNKQPDGSAALWIRVNQPLTGDVAAIEFNGVLLQGNISGNLVTAGVPLELYAKPGSYKVDVIARRGNASMQSNDVTFTVQ